MQHVFLIKHSDNTTVTLIENLVKMTASLGRAQIDLSRLIPHVELTKD